LRIQVGELISIGVLISIGAFDLFVSADEFKVSWFDRFEPHHRGDRYRSLGWR
jgi:hypothetical protein